MSLPPVVILVPGRADVLFQTARQARLLGHLPQGTVAVVLAFLTLALGQRPVVVAGTVDDENLELSVGPDAPHDAPGGPDFAQRFTRSST
jgi:hypothetical protein